MKPVTRIFFVLGAFVVCLPVWSQNLDPPTVKNNSAQIQEDNSPVGGTAAGASGYQQGYLNLGKECGLYLCEQWKPGSIELEDGTVFDNRMIRYNIYNQQMEYAVGGDTAAIGNPEDIAKLEIEDKVFVFRSFYCNDQVRQGYLELLVDGDYELLLHRGIKYIYEESESTERNAGPVTRYYQDNRYFLSCHGKIAEQLPDKKNEILSMLDKDQKKLKKYVKENKCKLKTQDDITDFFVFVNNN